MVGGADGNEKVYVELGHKFTGPEMGDGVVKAGRLKSLTSVGVLTQFPGPVDSTVTQK